MDYRFLNVIGLGLSVAFLVVDVQAHIWLPIPMWALVGIGNLLVVVPVLRRLWFGEKQPLVRHVHWPRQW
jgi:hypothetical protein